MALSLQRSAPRCQRTAQLSSSVQTLCLSRLPSTRPARRPAPAARRQPARQLAVRAGNMVDPKDPWWEKNSAPNMRSIESVDQLITELSQARDQLVVIDFFARWCGSCKALYPKLCKLSSDNPDMLLLKVDFDSNKKLCKAMGVKVLPFFQFYRGAEGRVAGFSASVAKVQRLRDALALYGSPRCSIGNSPIVSELANLLATSEDGRVVPGPGSLQDSSAQAVPT